jgi:hypothetical protein
MPAGLDPKKSESLDKGRVNLLIFKITKKGGRRLKEASANRIYFLSKNKKFLKKGVTIFPALLCCKEYRHSILDFHIRS